jgi:hypothetical protein
VVELPAALGLPAAQGWQQWPRQGVLPHHAGETACNIAKLGAYWTAFGNANPSRLTELRAMREAESKKPGYQRLRIMQYDELRRKLTSSQGLTVSREAVSVAALGGRLGARPGGGPKRAGRPVKAEADWRCQDCLQLDV